MAASEYVPIEYPSFPEHLETLRRQSGFSFADIASFIDVTEQTVIGWFDGKEPGGHQRSAIEKELQYSFRERRFAECANAVGFPSQDAPEEIRALRTYAALLVYCQAALKHIPQSALRQFLGWSDKTSASRTFDGSHIPEPERLMGALRRLPELPLHLDGTVLSVCTPRVIFGRIIRDCRQRRGFGMEQYAKRVVGVPSGVTRGLENEARGMRASSRDDVRDRSEGGKSGYFKDQKALNNLITFLNGERAALGIAPTPRTAAPARETPAAPAATAPMASAVPISEALPRLQALYDRIGSIDGTADALRMPRATIRDILLKEVRPHKRTRNRLRDAIPLAEARVHTAEAPPFAAVPPTPERTPIPSASGVDRTAQLEARVNDLAGKLEHLIAQQVAHERAPVAAADVFPFQPEKFRVHDDVVSDADLIQIGERIRRVIADLAHLAGIHDDTRRRAIGDALVPVVDDLFVAMEGFLKDKPSGALQFLQEQHAWVARQRANLKVQHRQQQEP